MFHMHEWVPGLQVVGPCKQQRNIGDAAVRLSGTAKRASGFGQRQWLQPRWLWPLLSTTMSDEVLLI